MGYTKVDGGFGVITGDFSFSLFPFFFFPWSFCVCCIKKNSFEPNDKGGGEWTRPPYQSGSEM